MIAELQRRAAEEHGDANAVIEYVEDYVASGKTLTDLAKSISAVCRTHVMRESLSKFIHSLGENGEIEARLLRARARGAHSIAEETLVIADEADEDDVQVAALKVKTRQWLAGKWNRDEFAEQKGTNVSISFNSLHLDALRTRATAVGSVSPALLAPAPNETETVDAVVEVIETA